MGGDEAVNIVDEKYSKRQVPKMSSLAQRRDEVKRGRSSSVGPSRSKSNQSAKSFDRYRGPAMVTAIEDYKRPEVKKSSNAEILQGWPKSDAEIARLKPGKANYLKRGGGTGGGAKSQIEIDPH